MTLQHADAQRHLQGFGAEDADDRLVVRLRGFHRRELVITAGGAVVDHEIVAALGFDDITERGEGFLGQRLDFQATHGWSTCSFWFPSPQGERGS
ncbi:hypothetical protein D3C80_1979330 [compost metagenome]